eukprot:scaffold50224_cov17-Tisochrysis_lutea.AAC.1
MRTMLVIRPGQRAVHLERKRKQRAQIGQSFGDQELSLPVRADSKNIVDCQGPRQTLRGLFANYRWIQNTWLSPLQPYYIRKGFLETSLNAARRKPSHLQHAVVPCFAHSLVFAAAACFPPVQQPSKVQQVGRLWRAYPHVIHCTLQAGLGREQLLSNKRKCRHRGLFREGRCACQHADLAKNQAEWADVFNDTQSADEHDRALARLISAALQSAGKPAWETAACQSCVLLALVISEPHLHTPGLLRTCASVKLAIAIAQPWSTLLPAAFNLTYLL